MKEDSSIMLELLEDHKCYSSRQKKIIYILRPKEI